MCLKVPDHDFNQLMKCRLSFLYDAGQTFYVIKFQQDSAIGSGCSTAVECTSHNREVVGLTPAGCWAFILLLSSVMCS